MASSIPGTELIISAKNVWVLPSVFSVSKKEGNLSLFGSILGSISYIKFYFSLNIFTIAARFSIPFTGVGSFPLNF